MRTSAKTTKKNRVTQGLFATLACTIFIVSPVSAETGEQLFAKGKVLEALPLFKNQITDHPDNVRARYYLSLIFLQQSKRDQAWEQLKKILELAPHSAEADYARQIATTYHFVSDLTPRATADSKHAEGDDDLRNATRQASELSAQAEREAQALDRKADQLAHDMEATPAVGRRSWGSAYNQAAIDDATRPLRLQATAVRERGKREAADYLMKAQLRASYQSSGERVSRPENEGLKKDLLNNDRQQSVPYIDEISYWRVLKKMQLGSNLWSALLLKPKFREQILTGKASVEEIKNSYTASEKSSDAAWIQAHQSAQRQFAPSKDLPVDLAGYDINQFVGLRCGSYHSLFDDDGICYKIFFDFKDASSTLTPEIYLQFVKRLAENGFVGDSKISMQPGFVRFNYNDIIVHTGSPKMAQLAEAVGVEIFNSRLEYVGRGVDVRGTDSVNGRGNTLDWHHYLAASSDLSRLSQKALNFLGTATP
ncbi:MAG TPA: tetratricopeptide repeat protein [Drouetiella sp.]|jgi:tetratricopeptide (TPR) repeat protein